MTENASLKIRKLGKISAFPNGTSMWKTHMMAPSPILLNMEIVRVFVGGWDEKGISRIWAVDVETKNPLNVVGVSGGPVLDIGEDGCFDENGVFPAHSYKFDNGKIYLYYTGFQLGHKIRHYNFGGLAICEENKTNFFRYSKAPILDRAEEGLFVRAGQSLEIDEFGQFHSVYSSGSSWFKCAGELRPVYDVFYQKSPDGIHLGKNGRKIITADLSIEHGLGRPQIIKLGEFFYIFYTRRIIKDMKYFLGCSRSRDLVNWERTDNYFDDIKFGASGSFDSEMIYFPGVVKVSENKALLFYSGNYFGKEGMGAMEVHF